MVIPRETHQRPHTFFQKSVLLGRQLEEMPEGIRWKVLADFWVEMLLYAAPSENVKEHIEQLAKGGEFITHLWALLSHAGILERDVDESNIKRVTPHRLGGSYSRLSCALLTSGM
jgi:hypothetical protein